MNPHQQTITPEAYGCLLQAHHSLQQQNDVCSRNIQTLCQHNDSLMRHIESLYQTISSLSTENTALRRDYEALRTKFTDFKQNSDHSFTPERKLEKEEKSVVLQETQTLNFSSAPVTEDAKDQNQKDSFLRGKKFWQVKEKRSLQHYNTIAGFEDQSLSAFQSRRENFKTRTFWESKQKRTSYQDKDNLKKVDMFIANENLLKPHEREEPLEHINRRVPEEDMCQQELSMNDVGLKAEVESLEQDKDSVKEHENSTDLSEQSKEQEEEAEYQALLKELEDIQLQVATHQDLNEVMKSNAQEEEDKLQQLLKEAKDELDSVAVCNKSLIKDINSERKMAGVLNATVDDLEEQCGKLLLMNFLERNKHQKEMRSRREPELWQWEANRWGDSD